MSKVTKTLSLQRAYFSEGFNGDLESILKGIFARKSKISERVVPADLVSSILFASLAEPIVGDGVYLRVFKVENGAIGLVQIEHDDEQTIFEEFFHPGNGKFLKDQLILYVSGNSIVACNIKNPSSVSIALCRMIGDCGLSEDGFSLRISDVPDRRELDQIKRHGVKSLKFNISSYMANLEPFIERGQGVGAALRSIFSAPDSNDEIKKRANAVGTISLSRGRFDAKEVKRDEWLTQIGHDLVDDENIESFRIVLENGVEISNEKLKKSKAVRLPRRANTYSYDHATMELRAYYSELFKEGMLNG